MNDEDRLTYALQASGPDEFPEGYYRAIAREQLGRETYKDRMLTPDAEDFLDGDRHLIAGTDYSHVPHRGHLTVEKLGRVIAFQEASAERRAMLRRQR